MSLHEQLPMVRSIEETAELWPTLTRRQKVGAGMASMITLMGPIGRIVSEAHQGNDQSASPGELIAGIAVDLRDGLDGKVARAMGGVTPFGKELDPFADKIDFMIQEIFEQRRGNLPLPHLALRFARDALVTGLRSHVMAVTDGQANVAANIWGKGSTLFRQASNRMTGLPLENSIPHFRTAHQTTATGLLLLSGGMNVRQLLDERNKYLFPESSENAA
jgi:phosphatidylglycerophosphate synthase